jgi:GNAT superfamily N-acetyltransferase
MPMVFEEISFKDPIFIETMALYKSSFPPVETKPIDKIIRLLKKEDYHLYVALLNGRLQGFSSLFISRELKFGSLDYLAVCPSLRGKGIGTALLKFTMNELLSKVQDSVGLLLEVEREDLAANERERALRQARLRFYLRMGAMVITNGYLMPPQCGTAPEEMYLMIIPARNHAVLSRGSFEGFVWSLHSKVYCYRKRDLLARTAMRLPETLEM